MLTLESWVQILAVPLTEHAGKDMAGGGHLGDLGTNLSFTSDLISGVLRLFVFVFILDVYSLLGAVTGNNPLFRELPL